MKIYSRPNIKRGDLYGTPGILKYTISLNGIMIMIIHHKMKPMGNVNAISIDMLQTLKQITFVFTSDFVLILTGV